MVHTIEIDLPDPPSDTNPSQLDVCTLDALEEAVQKARFESLAIPGDALVRVQAGIFGMTRKLILSWPRA